jgi:hypothetical protein
MQKIDDFAINCAKAQSPIKEKLDSSPSAGPAQLLPKSRCG